MSIQIQRRDIGNLIVTLFVSIILLTFAFSQGVRSLLGLNWSVVDVNHGNGV